MTDSTHGSLDAPLPTPQAILQRRSVRHYRDEPVDESLLARLLELTVAAPSSWNLQPWRIVVVQDAENRARLADACFKQPQPKEAGAVFVFAISHAGWRDVFDEVIDEATERGAWSAGYVEMFRKMAAGSQEGLGDRLREYNTKDALIAATHLSLAAESLGLGSSFMNGFDESRVKEVIGAADDDDIGVVLVLAIGHPEVRGQNPGRLPLSRTVFAESLDHPWHDGTRAP